MSHRPGLDRCGKFRPHRHSIPGRPARSESLYHVTRISDCVSTAVARRGKNFCLITTQIALWKCYKILLVLKTEAEMSA